MKKYSIILVSVFTLTIISCRKDKVQAPIVAPAVCTDTILFSSQIEPMINLNCNTSGCHNASAAGGYNLMGYSNIQTNANIILSVMKHEGGVANMPLGGAKLSDSLIQQMNCWILQGKLHN